jgi:hypothetical protein
LDFWFENKPSGNPAAFPLKKNPTADINFFCTKKEKKKHLFRVAKFVKIYSKQIPIYA